MCKFFAMMMFVLGASASFFGWSPSVRPEGVDAATHLENQAKDLYDFLLSTGQGASVGLFQGSEEADREVAKYWAERLINVPPTLPPGVNVRDLPTAEFYDMRFRGGLADVDEDTLEYMRRKSDAKRTRIYALLRQEWSEMGY